MVSEVDRESEALILQRIAAARPEDGVLGEEGASKPGTSGIRWVIDPLDGTTNYLYRIPAFCVSIGVERDGETVAGVVYDPSRVEMYSASKGTGAHRNGVPIRVSEVQLLAVALTGTGFGYAAELREKQGALVARVLPQVRDIRRIGSAALDLCGVACGRLDAYYEGPLNAWDYVAGALIVREAGGDWAKVATPASEDTLVAGNPVLMGKLTELLQG